LRSRSRFSLIGHQSRFSPSTRWAPFARLGLEQHLTPQRSNGVRAMIERIHADAAAA